MNTYTLHRGARPLLISVPHDGTLIPEDTVQRLTDSARRLPDTDWHVARLYAFARDLGASIIVPQYSRYVVDLNRGEDDASLYPGQNTTGLCPVVQFDGTPIYREDMQPTPDEIRQRVEHYWRPYHVALRNELTRLREEHGRVVLWEGHSIKSELPFLFEGRLPDLNLGTASGASCTPELQRRLEQILATQGDYAWVANGRFKGGYITRHYGDPANGIEAVQLELTQRNYMDEESFKWVPECANRLQPLIRRLLEAALAA